MSDHVSFRAISLEGHSGRGTQPDTDLVPDASKITPPVKSEGERAGHDISLSLNVNAGVPIQSVQSKLHEVDVQRPSANLAQIKLKNKNTIPNKDFVATWSVAAGAIQSGYLTHRQGDDGFFTLMLIPPKRVTPSTVQPKEMIFLIDCSGSQRGQPLEKAKEVMLYILDHMNPSDTFQVLTFNDTTAQFSPHAELASKSMKERATNFISPLQANGGTWMGPAVEKVCAMPNEDHRLRIVTFMTDGLVGNDMEVIDTIKKYRGQSRWYSFGTGNSVNRFVLENIAKEGGGEVDYVLLNSSAEAAGKKFYDRISSPVLTDIKVEFNGVEAKEIFPKDVTDLWAQKPVFITGRYTKPGSGKVVLSGYSGGKPYKQELKLDFPAVQASNDVLPSIWARAKVEKLMSQDWKGLQFNQNDKLKTEITDTALKYHIMSQYTSFVAVEEDRKTKDGTSKTIDVPVELPEGVMGSGETQRHGGRWSFAPNTYKAEHARKVSSATVRAGIGTGSGASLGVAVGAIAGSGQDSGVDYSFSTRLEGQRSLKGTSRTQIQEGASFYNAAQDPGPGSEVLRQGLFAQKPNSKPFELAVPEPNGEARDKNLLQVEPSTIDKGQYRSALTEEEKGKKAGMPNDKLDKKLRELILSSKNAKALKRVLKVKVELRESPGSDLLDRLNKAGLRVSKREGNAVLGEIELQMLDELVDISEVQKITLL